ncbi:MAG: outer membrane protein [Methylovirgula sp.]
MNKFLLTSVAIIVAAPAMAADLPLPVYKEPAAAPAPYFSWTGPYIGVNAGGGWENTKTDYSYSSIPAPAPPGFDDVFESGGILGFVGGTPVGNAIASGFLPTALGNSGAGFFTAGGQIGYNYQINQIVVGGEADFDWINDGFRSTGFVAPPNGIITNVATSSAGLAWLSTVRARAGFAFDRALVFATGGLAFGRTSAAAYASNFDGSNTDLFSGSGSGVRTGFAVGGGVEYAFTSNLSAKLEYLYYDLGTANYEVAAANSIAAGEGIFIYGSQKFDGNIVRLGLNYRFDWNAPVVARY